MEWKIGDVLAILTLVGGVASYSVNAYKDREVKAAENANKVRAAAAQLLGKVNALHQAVPSVVIRAQQVVVDTKLKLLRKYEPDTELHTLWGTLLKSKSEALQMVAALQTDPSYLAFYTFSPQLKPCVDAAILRINGDLNQGFKDVFEAVEEARLEMPRRRDDYVPAQLYNRISAPLVQMQQRSAGSIRAQLAPIEAHLINVIGRSNDALLTDRMQVDSVPGCAGA